MPRAKLKNTNCPHSHYIQGLTMNPLPVPLSALKTGVLLTTQIHYRAQRKSHGAFCFGKLYNLFSCLPFNSPTGIRRAVGRNQTPFSLSQAQEHTQKGSGSIFAFHPYSYYCPHFFIAVTPCSFRAQSLTASTPAPSTLDLVFQRHYLNASQQQFDETPPSTLQLCPLEHPSCPLYFLLTLHSDTSVQLGKLLLLIQISLL